MFMKKMLPRLFIKYCHKIQCARINPVLKKLYFQLDARNLSTSDLQYFAAHAHKTTYNMDKVYLRHEENTPDLHISFRYKNPELKIDRDFNFCRKIDEKIDLALTRIGSNIEKEQLKRNKSKKKDTAEQIILSKISVHIHKSADNSPVPADITFGELLNDETLKEQLQLRILEQSFDVVYNQPWVLNLVMPQSCMTGFLVYPNKLEIQFAERAFSRGLWYKSKMPQSGDLERGGTWIECGKGISYVPTTDDIGYHLKIELTPGNSKNEFGPPVEGIIKSAVQASPGVCPFETRHQFTSQRLKNDELRVVSYNLLADYYADSDYSRNVLFPYCPSYILKIDYRKQLYIKELLGYNADIMCLQEVDTKIFENDLKPLLESDGFGGIMTPKGTCAEGVAMFYRRDRFDLLNKFELNIGDQVSKLPEFSKLWNSINHNKPLVERLCDRSTTLQVSLLYAKETDMYLLVANTHLYFHPDADHIRLLQAAFAVMYIEKLYEEAQNRPVMHDRIGIIFCGDFNSTPECGIYKLMTERFVNRDFIDWKSNAQEAVENVELSQPYEMGSACGTPKYTNYTLEFAACLDYIFYQKTRFTVKEVIPLPAEEELKAHKAIPSVVFPSDHVSLVADLKFK